MNMKTCSLLGIFVVFLTVVKQGNGKIYTRCGLGEELKKSRFFAWNLQDWVCLIENESSRNTEAVHKNGDGTIDYGLFQINDKFWCGKNGTKGGECKIPCTTLLKGGGVLGGVEACVEKIYKRHGFKAWYGWKDKCDGKPLPDLRKECPRLYDISFLNVA